MHDMSEIQTHVRKAHSSLGQHIMVDILMMRDCDLSFTPLRISGKTCTRPGRLDKTE